MASDTPQSPAMRKNIILFPGCGFHIRRAIRSAMCKANAKAIIGARPVFLTIPPTKIAAIALLTPKQIITNPMLLIPHPHETKDCIERQKLGKNKNSPSTLTYRVVISSHKSLFGTYKHGNWKN